jgi:FtsP/CotA-like multicopper oxidase with cupredoxin domain
MANVSTRNRRKEKEILDAAKNRRELIAARLSRRDLMRMGLLTTAGFLVPKRGLSARSQWGWGGSGSGCYGGYGTPPSPPTTPFVEPLPITPIHQPVTQLTGPAPTVSPNTAINPATGLPYEGRTRAHQAFVQFPPQKLYEVHQEEVLVSVHPELPIQRMWGFNGSVPPPTYVARYGEPILVRNYNDLPASNGGFGIQSVSTHLHNAHTPSESDGFPCDFFEVGQYYDQHYPNVLAGFSSTNPPNGDIRESLGTLWYHDHRVDFTSQNVYKGLAGFYLLFNDFDTGDETTGFRLPSFPDYDIPMIITDKNFDPQTGLLAFDLANRDGVLGDKFLVNGKIQPFLEVKRRRYRFRWLNGGPSRFHKIYLTNPNSLNTTNPFWVIANDGNLLPNPVQVSGVEIAVAERMDVIIDFSAFPAGTILRLENRLEQCDGAGPTDNVLSAGQGDYLLEFRVVSDPVTDQSVNPATNPHFYDVPPLSSTNNCRSFDFDRRNGQWVINDKLFDCEDVAFRVKRNTAEQWKLSGGFDWQHPIHIHFEEFQITSRGDSYSGGGSVPPIERGRKDVVRLGRRDNVSLFIRFRDFVGRYPMHCHNIVHEDHAMMLRFEIDDVGNSGESCDSGGHHH